MMPTCKLSQTEVPVSMMVALRRMLEWTNSSTMIKLIKLLASTLSKVVSIHVSLVLMPVSHFITCSLFSLMEWRC